MQALHSGVRTCESFYLTNHPQETVHKNQMTFQVNSKFIYKAVFKNTGSSDAPLSTSGGSTRPLSLIIHMCSVVCATKSVNNHTDT